MKVYDVYCGKFFILRVVAESSDVAVEMTAERLEGEGELISELRAYEIASEYM